MNFRTPIEDISFPFRIKPSDKLFFIGSCFASNIGNMLSSYKFDCQVNPFGAAYNPASICDILNILLNNTEIDCQSYVNIENKFYSTTLSTAFFASNKEKLSEDTKHIIALNNKKLIQSDYIFITLGTSWVYRNIATNKIVNNCLKLPASHFDRFSLEVDDIVDKFSNLIDSNPSMKSKHIILSVSPIRHIKDGLVENTISKSTLILSINSLMKKYDNISYFPAFEIVNDDLRDYRFFNDDMIHPSTVAIDYIFEKFSKWILDENSIKFIKECSVIINGINHRPFDRESDTHKDFCNKMIKKIEELESKYPFVSFNEQRCFFNK